MTGESQSPWSEPHKVCLECAKIILELLLRIGRLTDWVN